MFRRPVVLTGSCLCGAVAWEADGNPTSVHHCHCGMCRRWTGGGFATLVWFARDSVRWTNGEPTVHRSSPIAVRAHCGTCGTPLYLAYDGQDEIALTAGSMNQPEAVTPDHHYGVEGRLSWADIGQDLPAEETRERF